MAGKPTDEDDRRQRARIQRLGQGLVHWERASVGQQVTTDALSSLPARAWAVLHDLRWSAPERADADHVVVGRGGVFVIDTKNWSGRVSVVDGVLRNEGHPRGVAGAAGAAAAVGRLLDPRSARTVRPVVCIARDEAVAGVVDGVLICSTWNVRELLLSRPRALSRRQVRAVVRQLQPELRPSLARPGQRSVRPGSGRDSALKDAVRAGLLLLIVGTVASRPDVVTEPVERLGEVFWHRQDS